MLLPEQVLPFLNHADEDVRRLAAQYFEFLGEKSPSQTEVELWRAIDAVGFQKSSFGNPACVPLFHALADVQQTDDSVTRALDLLKKAGSNEEFRSCVFEYLQTIPIELLIPHRDLILNAVDDPSRGVLEDRLRLNALSGEQLWQEFLDLGIQTETVTDSGKVDGDTAQRLVRALCAHPQLACARAMEVLSDSENRYWLETWCIDLLGRLRENSAIDLMLNAIITDEGDFMNSSATFALGRMDPEQVVPKLEAGYGELESEDTFTRQRIPETLGKIQHPLAEAALLRLLARESDEGVITATCIGLIDICTTDGLEAIRQVVIDQRYDTSLADVMSELMTLAKLTDYHPPEMQEWIADLADPVKNREKRRKFLATMGITLEQSDTIQEYFKDKSPEEIRTVIEQAMAAPGPDEEEEPYVPLQPIKPIRRDAPKIGRNDPCPCGSGKKFKKCCGQ